MVWRDEKLTESFKLSKENTRVFKQEEGIEHYITPATMRYIRNLIIYFSSDPHRIHELDSMQCNSDYPDHEDLQYLRAWLF